MTSDKAKADPNLPKFSNTSDPRQRLNTMIYVFSVFPRSRKSRSARSATNSTDDAIKDRDSRRILAAFAKTVKKASTAFGLDPADELDRTLLLGALAWVLFGKSARRGRPRSEDRIMQDIGKRIAPALARNPHASATELGKMLRNEPAEQRKPDTLRKLVSRARTR
jgi:hypothetical protein